MSMSMSVSTRKKWTVGLVAGAAVVVSLGSGIALAARHGAGGASGARGFAALEGAGLEPLLLRRLARELDLTPEQKQRVRRAVAAEWERGLGQAADAARLAHRDLRHAIHDPGSSEAQVRAAAGAAAAADESLALARHQAVQTVLPVLSDEQKEKARSLGEELDEVGDRVFARIDAFLRRG